MCIFIVLQVLSGIRLQEFFVSRIYDMLSCTKIPKQLNIKFHLFTNAFPFTFNLFVAIVSFHEMSLTYFS